MGGKVWTEKEEKTFWLQIIPQSPKRVGADKANPEKSWKVLAKEMQRRLGEDSKRKYTALMLFEHFFQNAVNRKFSPKARRLAEAYIAKQNPEELEQQKMSRRRILKSFDPEASGPSSDPSSGSGSGSGSGTNSSSSPTSSGSEEEPVPNVNHPAHQVSHQVSLPSFSQIATYAGGYYDTPNYDTAVPENYQNDQGYYGYGAQYGAQYGTQYDYGENQQSYPYPHHSQYQM